MVRYTTACQKAAPHSRCETLRRTPRLQRGTPRILDNLTGKQTRGIQRKKYQMWRTTDHHPLCFHCGKGDHVFTHCPCHRIDFAGFTPSTSRAHRNERLEAIDDYLRQQRTMPQSPLRRFLSPPPRHSDSSHCFCSDAHAPLSPRLGN